MADRVTKVTLTAQVGGYLAGMSQAEAATRKTTQATQTAKEKYEEQNRAMESAGKGLLVMGAATGVALGLTVKAAMDWQSSWAGVTKTVEGTPAELAAVEAGLRGLAKELPPTHTEIAAVAEAAGQLGIATPNVVAFTRTMIDLGETTNLSAEEAATALARFMNVMGTSQDKVSNLGASIVELGNNYATTEGEILAMASRLSGAAVQIGLSEGQTMGLAAALSSVGIEAEAGGSAMSKVMIDIASSVDKGGARVELFAKTAGMSADEFSTKWKTAPGEALAAFVKGLADTEAQGTTTFAVLEELGITEVRMRDALLRSASASDQFNSAMQMGNTAFEENNALTEEAAKRYETAESKVRVAGNAIVDTAIGIGQSFLPVVASAAEGIADFAGLIGDLPEPVLAVAGGTLALVTAVSLAGGVFLVGVPKIAAYNAALATLSSSSMPAVARAATGLASATSMAGTAMGAVSRFMMGPWGLAVAGAATVVGLLVSENSRLDKSAGELVDTLDESTGAVTANSKAWAANQLQQEGILSAARNLGISAEVMTDAWLGNASAIETVKGKLSEMKDEFNSGGGDKDKSLLPEGWVEDSTKLTKALGDSNEVLSKAKNRHDELKEATGGSTKATAAAAAPAKSVGDAYLESAQKANELISKVLELAKAMNDSNDVGQKAIDTGVRYQESLAAAQESLEKARQGEEGYALSLDINTEAGRNNLTMLTGLAKDSQTAAQAQLELDAKTVGATQATANYMGTAAAGRQTIVDMAMAYGMSAEEAQQLADKIYAIPDQKQVNILASTAAADEAIEGFMARNANRIIRINAVAELPDLNGSASGSGRPGIAVGGLFAYANGGLNDHVQAFAGGTGIYSGRKDSLYKFAEQETRWEAFISGKPGQEKRNVGIALEALNRLGHPVVSASSAAPFANGSMPTYVQAPLSVISAPATTQGSTYNVTVNGTPGMSATEITDKVMKRLERATR